MILLHRFKEKIGTERPTIAGTETFTRTRAESNDRDPYIMAMTKTATAIRAESPDTDQSTKSGTVFPRHSDSDYNK